VYSECLIDHLKLVHATLLATRRSFCAKLWSWWYIS